MKCKKCEKFFNTTLASCGAGNTWTLLKCPHCGQFFAYGNIIPKKIFQNRKIWILNK
jgi:rRNA maturation protein Nop10